RDRRGHRCRLRDRVYVRRGGADDVSADALGRSHDWSGVEAAVLEVGDEVGDQLLGLAAAGSVADGDDGDLVLPNELFEPGLGVGVTPLSVRVDHGVFEKLAGLVEDGEFEAGANAWVDRQDLPPAQW